MNSVNRRRIDKLKGDLRAAIEEIRVLKYRETLNFSARCPNGVEHHPATWAWLSNAETGLSAVLGALDQARRVSGFGVVAK